MTRRRLLEIIEIENTRMLEIAHLRCKVVHHLTGPLTSQKIRTAITSEVRKRSEPAGDGFYDVETNIGHVETTCFAYFYAALGLGNHAVETIYRDAWDLSEQSAPNFYGNDSSMRSLARIANKIGLVGEFHPVDASIMIPPSESRTHFLRTGKKGKSIVHRKTLRATFGATVRVHKANSFMRCACCIAMKLYTEDRLKLHNEVSVLLNENYQAGNDVRKGTFVRDAAHKLAEERLGTKNFVTMRKKLREKREWQEEVPEEEAELEEYEDAVNGGGAMEDEDGAQHNLGPIAQLDWEGDNLHQQFLDGNINQRDYLDGLKQHVQKLASVENTMRRFHYKCIRMERVLIYSAQEAAAACPEEVCTLIIDGCGKDRTKIPYYCKRMKGIADDNSRMKCPVYGIQEAVPIRNSTEGSHTGESDFELFTHDFVVALEWTKVGGADLYASILLEFLVKKDVVPRVIALVLDNAPVNKGEPIMTWLAFIMLHTEIEEIHVYYPSTGHTHTTLDAHFGKAKPKDPKKVVLTPQDLKRHLESLPRTRAILNFALYPLADKLCTYAHSYTNRLEQHHYVLFKDNKGGISFKYTPLLRYAYSDFHTNRYLFSIHHNDSMIHQLNHSPIPHG